MVMMVQCRCCMTEYRLDEGLLKGAKGACIRCPKCRERIIVVNPQRPPVASPRMPCDAPLVASPNSPPKVPPPAPPAAVETGTTPIRAAAPEGMTSLVPRDRRAEGADLSEMIQPNPVAGIVDGIRVSPTPNAISASIISRGKALRLEEPFIHPSALEGDWIPGGEEYGPMAIRSPDPGWDPPPRRTLYRRPLFLAAMISILLLAGGTFYFVDGNSGRTSSDNVVPARVRSIPANSVFNVGNVNGFFIRKPSREPLYVIKGTVTNIGKALSSGIRIEATLVGKDNQAIVKGGTFAGNVIDESLIPHMSRARIEGFLGMRHGEGDVNRDIPAGKILPFLVVFFDPPEGIESFRVKVIDAEGAEQIDSPDGKEPGTRASNQQSIRFD